MIYAIGQIRKGKEVIGYKLKDMNTGEEKLVPTDSVKAVIEAGKVSVQNMQVNHGRLEGKGIQLEGLSQVLPGTGEVVVPRIIILDIKDGIYTILDEKGEIRRTDEEGAMLGVMLNGTANNLEVTNRDGKGFRLREIV